MITKNLIDVQKNIEQACLKSNRSVDEVTLIAVSKTKPLSMIQEVYDFNIRNFGENKVQEIMAKYDHMPKDTLWHMIGHLQRNKVKYIIDKVCMIHSVDSLRLAEEISKEAVKKQVTVSILIEVNVANESTKFGLAKEETIALVKEIATLPNIIIKGLMTVAPYVDDPEENRQVFRSLKQLFIDINKENIDNVIMSELSMGMTNDYMVAIEEGATMVRVGTGIFGERNYNK